MPEPTLDIYLFFDGNAAEAMQHYQRVLGGELESLMTYGQSPDPHPDPANQGRVMHSSLRLAGRHLMASDMPVGMYPGAMRSASVSLSYDDAADARRTFDALAEGGRIDMPMAETFWADAFGGVTDRFGTSWLVGGGHKPLP